MAVTSSTEPFVILEATSITISAFSINNCYCAQLDGSTTKWIVWCTTGTDAVKRAQIYKTLFYGTSGAEYALASVTGLTAIKVNTTNSQMINDVGKIAWLRLLYATHINATITTFNI